MGNAKDGAKKLRGSGDGAAPPPRYFCPVPGCYEGNVNVAAGWSSWESFKEHL